MLPKSNTPATIDEYIAGFPLDIQAILQQVRATIRAAAPDAQEAISYQMPTFKHLGHNLVHFAAFKKHIGFYPTPSAIVQFKDELAAYVSATGSVQFPLNQPIPYALIHEMVIARIKESHEKAAAKSKKKHAS